MSVVKPQTDRLDRFADMLAAGCTIPQIREQMGLSNGAAQRIMCTIRKGLGWQAK